jgi:heparan-alpha-glucosaminide N-acetyltransferase
MTESNSNAVSLAEAPVSVSTERPAVREPKTSPKRLVSLDAFRGATMLFMASEIMRIPDVLRSFAACTTCQFFADLLSHKEWVGCAPWDLIQPSFMFMVGVSLPYSIASRIAKGQSFRRMFGHAVYRSLLLILLGIFLRSQHSPQTYFTFEDVLSQIGLGYVFLFLLALVRPKIQAIVAVCILVGYWAIFALYPLPAADFDTTAVGVARDWPHQLTGFSAHWNKNTNLASRADQWFLNRFPREKPFIYNRGGYLTLNFVPSLATMVLGLLAGGLLRSERSSKQKMYLLIRYGALAVILGFLLHSLGICPLVKRIWTPTWTIYSTGWALLLLAGFYYFIDIKGHQRWAFPLLVVGTNSIAMYFLVHVIVDYVASSLKIHLGPHIFEIFGTVYSPIVEGGAVLVVLWLLLFWMYQRKIFLRI